jgi:hypothetical protein
VCSACQRCDLHTGQCVPDPAAIGHVCGDGQVCQVSGACLCSGGSCGRCRSCQGNGTCQTCSGTSPTCCDGVCVDTTTDPHHCGGCGHRCQVGGRCERGFCTCLNGGCEIANFTCCAVPGITICGCGPTGSFFDPTTCTLIPSCPAERQCIGPSCHNCCPVGATCDPTTGACLQ